MAARWLGQKTWRKKLWTHFWTVKNLQSGCDNAMKTKTDAAKNVRGDSATFTEFMRKLIAVPHSEIKAEMEAEKAVKRRPRPFTRMADVSSFRVPGAGSKRGD
jgi:hypothetical protein